MMVAPQHQPGLCLARPPLCRARCVHSAECTQPKLLRDVFLLASKGTRQTALAQGQGSSREMWSAPAGAAQGLITPRTPAQVQVSWVLAAGGSSPCSWAALVASEGDNSP